MSDGLLRLLLWPLALASGALVLLIGVFVLHEAWPALSVLGLKVWFSDPGWHPLAGQYRLLPMIVGTVLAASGAVLLAIPLALASAVFCQFYAPSWLARLWRRLVELMAGIPSVVYGLWGLMVLVPVIRDWAPPGPSLLAAILVLALMILPTLAMSADAALAAVPGELRRAGTALALGRARYITAVALPAARAGILTGLLLAAGRAVGETLAVVLVAGNVVQVPGSLFEPVRVLTANIALELAYALDLHRAALFASALVLFLLTAFLVLAAERLSRGRRWHAPA